MGPTDGKLWTLAALSGLLCACGAFRQQRKPQPPVDSIELEGEGTGADAAAASQAARRDALDQALRLFVSTSAALGPKELEDLGGYLGEGETVGSGRRGGLPARRDRFSVRYRALGADLERRGLVHPGAISGRPLLLLSLDDGSSWSADAAKILAERLDEAGFKTVVASPEHPAAEARRLAARVLVQGSAGAAPVPGDPGRLVSEKAFYDLTASWIPEESTAPAVVLPGRLKESAQAYELAPEDAAARAADNASIAVAGRLRTWLADRLDERYRMTVLILSLGDLADARKFLAAVRAMPHVDAAALDVVAGQDARFHVWVRRTSADEFALKLKDLSGFHFIVRNVEPPYGWIELDTEDSY